MRIGRVAARTAIVARLAVAPVPDKTKDEVHHELLSNKRLDLEMLRKCILVWRIKENFLISFYIFVTVYENNNLDFYNNCLQWSNRLLFINIYDW